MKTLKERVEECERRCPQISQADVARAAGIKQPSVADWFNGKTVRLKLKPAVKAAELWGCAPLWLGEGEGSPNWIVDQALPAAQDTNPTKQAPDLAAALPVVLEALGSLTAGQWRMVRARLDDMAGNPSMRDDVAGDVLPLLNAPPGKRQSSP